MVFIFYSHPLFLRGAKSLLAVVSRSDALLLGVARERPLRYCSGVERFPQMLDTPGLLANATLALNVILVHDTLLSRAKETPEEVMLVIPSLQVNYLATGQMLDQ